jgi:hypothetical protein
LIKLPDDFLESIITAGMHEIDTSISTTITSGVMKCEPNQCADVVTDRAWRQLGIAECPI